MSGGVVLATPFSEHVSGQFMMSFARLVQYDAYTSGYLAPGRGGIMGLSTGPRVAEARSIMVDGFAEEPDYANAEWLLQIDADMVYGEDLVERLMAVADPQNVPILGGLCFAGGRNAKPYPTIYEEFEAEDGFIALRPVEDYLDDALIKVGATGAGCLLVHRQVFAAMKRPRPEGFGTLANGAQNPYPWFQEGLTGPHGEPLGEDVAFCRRARQLGIPVHVHTGIKLGHHKTFILGEEHYRAYKGGTKVQWGSATPQEGTYRQGVETLPVTEPGVRPNRSARRRAARAAMKAGVS